MPRKEVKSSALERSPVVVRFQAIVPSIGVVICIVCQAAAQDVLTKSRQRAAHRVAQLKTLRNLFEGPLEPALPPKPQVDGQPVSGIAPHDLESIPMQPTNGSDATQLRSTRSPVPSESRREWERRWSHYPLSRKVHVDDCHVGYGEPVPCGVMATGVFRHGMVRSLASNWMANFGRHLHVRDFAADPLKTGWSESRTAELVSQAGHGLHEVGASVDALFHPVKEAPHRLTMHSELVDGYRSESCKVCTAHEEDSQSSCSDGDGQSCHCSGSGCSDRFCRWPSSHLHAGALWHPCAAGCWHGHGHKATTIVRDFCAHWNDAVYGGNSCQSCASCGGCRGDCGCH